MHSDYQPVLFWGEYFAACGGGSLFECQRNFIDKRASRSSQIINIKCILALKSEIGTRPLVVEFLTLHTIVCYFHVLGSCIQLRQKLKKSQRASFNTKRSVLRPSYSLKPDTYHQSPSSLVSVHPVVFARDLLYTPEQP